METALPPNEKKRLTIDVHPWRSKSQAWFARVYLDTTKLLYAKPGETESEARAAADAYVSELLEHFRKGGT